jgi:hypothetical protein
MPPTFPVADSLTIRQQVRQARCHDISLEPLSCSATLLMCMIELHGHQAVSRNLKAVTAHGPDPTADDADPSPCGADCLNDSRLKVMRHHISWTMWQRSTTRVCQT